MNVSSRTGLRVTAVASTLALMVVLVSAAAALAAVSFSDPARDNTGALDITSATVSESGGRVTVVVELPGVVRMPAGSRIDLWFDLDNDLRTGDDGDEAFARYLANGTLSFSRWDGSELVRRPSTAMTVDFADGALTYSAPKHALDDVSSFGLLVVTRGVQEVEEDEIAAYDALPELGRATHRSPGPSTFGDREGDVPLAPDVTGATVSDAQDGTLRFSIATSDAMLSPGRGIGVVIDRDLVGEGSPFDRAEVYLPYADGKLSLLRWDPAEEEWIDDERPTRARAAVVGRTLVIEIHRSELDDVARFGFAVISWEEDEDEELVAADMAPDRSMWTYALTHRPPLRLIPGRLYGTPSRPLAGRPFAVNLPVRRSDTSRGLTSGKATCDVRSAGRKIVAVGTVRRGIARCELVVPREALDVRGSMVVRSAGKSITAWFAGAVDFGGGVVTQRRESR